MTDFSHITDETLKEWGGLSASLTSAPSKRDLTVSERLSKMRREDVALIEWPIAGVSSEDLRDLERVLIDDDLADG